MNKLIYILLGAITWMGTFGFVLAQESNDYTPTEVKVCELGNTTARICWKTKSPSNSEIVYGLATETLDSANNKPNFKAGTTFNNVDNHYLNLSGLKADTKYKYIVRSSPNKDTASTTSSEYTFTTKKADGTGGDTGGQSGGTGTPPKYDNKTDFDRPIGEALFNPLNSDVTRPEAIVVRIINILLFLAASIAVLFIILGGFMMVTSAGNEDRVKQGKKTLIYAVGGLIVTLLSFTIVAIIQSIIS